VSFLSKGGWIVVVLGLVAAWVGREVHNARVQGRLEARAERVAVEKDSLLGVVRDSLVAAEGVAREREQALTAVQDGMEQEMASLRRARQRALQDLDDVLNSMPDSQAAPIVAVIDTLEREVEVCEAALGTCEERVQAVHGQLEAMSRRALNAENLAERQDSLLLDLRNAPGQGFQLMDAVPWAAAVAGILIALLK